jgi:hypothetical protein
VGRIMIVRNLVSAGIALSILSAATYAEDFTPLIATDAAVWPLTAAEISDAVPCMTKYQLGLIPGDDIEELAICAGEKKISTGILLSPGRTGTALPNDTIVIFRMAPVVLETAGFEAISITTIKQIIESGGPEWQQDFYILSSAQLTKVISNARKNPSWKP